MQMIVKSRRRTYCLILFTIFLAPTAWQVLGQGQTGYVRTTVATSVRTIPNGDEMTISGNVIKVDGDLLSVVDANGAETIVQLTDRTHFVRDKQGFPKGKSRKDKYALLIGLDVKARGRGNEAGQMVGEWVAFHKTSFVAAKQLDTRVVPIERAQDKMAGDLAELTGISSSALSDARNAQSAADRAQSTADAAKTDAASLHQIVYDNRDRILNIDDFDTTEQLVVNFKVNSFELTQEAKDKLDAFIAKTAGATGYLVEIAAYASSEGGREHNLKLSENRGQSVMDYLINTGNVAQRRIVTPYPGGINKPIADNSTAEGRMMNRRAEIKLLVSKGLSKGPVVSTPNP